MKRLLIAVVALAAGGLAACSENESNDIAGVPLPGADAIDIRILGPEFLHENGEYRWIAEIPGESAEHAEFRWDVTWPGENAVRQTFLGPTLDLNIEADRQSTIELYVQVASNGRYGATASLVTICPLGPPWDVDDCGSRQGLER